MYVYYFELCLHVLTVFRVQTCSHEGMDAFGRGSEHVRTRTQTHICYTLHLSDTISVYVTDCGHPLRSAHPVQLAVYSQLRQIAVLTSKHQVYHPNYTSKSFLLRGVLIMSQTFLTMHNAEMNLP